MQAAAERYHKNLDARSSEYLAGRGIDEDTARRFLLGTCDDIHDGWISIPYLRPSGVVHFNFRRLDDGKPKYLASGPRHLFNTADLEIADETGEIALAEGEFDTIVASVSGVPCVGIPGATQWTGNKHWPEIFRGYQRIWILADPDDAGLSLAGAILEDLPQARLVKLPADVTDTVVRMGHDLKEFIGG